MLDFVRRVENLSLPEAIARLDGSPGLAPGALHRAARRPRRSRPAGRAASQVRRAPAVPFDDPACAALLTAAGRPRVSTPRAARRRSGSVSGAAPPPGSTWPRGASARPRQPASASAMRRAAGCESGRFWNLSPDRIGFAADRLSFLGLRAVHGAGRGAMLRLRLGWRRPDADGASSVFRLHDAILRRSRPLAVGRAASRPRPDAPVPGVARPQAGAWDGASRPGAVLETVVRRGGLRLARPGAVGKWMSSRHRPRRPGDLTRQGVERVAAALPGAAHCRRLPRLRRYHDDAGREATERLQSLLGRRAAAVALPEGVGDVAELAALPHGRTAFLRLLTQAARSAR